MIGKPDKKTVDVLDDFVDRFKAKLDAMSPKQRAKMQADAKANLAKMKLDAEAPVKYGAGVGKRFIKKYAAIPVKHDGKIYHDKGLNTNEASTALAEILYQCYSKDQQADCGELLMQWSHDKFWGKVVMEYIPRLEKIWKYLYDNKRNKNNTMDYGDCDGSIWFEPIKQKDKWPDGRKVIINKSHCSCADDRTYIFILDTSRHVSLGKVLQIRTVWDRQYQSPRHRNNPWGDDRDIDVPSLNTYRKRNFHYGYEDMRDEGYVLTLEESCHIPKIEYAANYASKIQHALWLIRHMENIVDDPETFECK